MRILYVSDVYFPRINGVSTSIQTFRSGIAALGHESLLIAPAYPDPYPDDNATYRVRSRRVPLDPEDRAMRWADLRAMHARLGQERIDLVHIQTPFLAHYAGLRFARARGLPCIATYHTLFEEYLFHYVPFAPKERMRALARWFSRRQCNALDALIVPSNAMRDTLRAYGIQTDIEIIPTGIPLSKFRSGNGARFRATQRFHAEVPLLLFVGRVAFEKNIDFLLRMHAQLLSRQSRAVLLICGEGPALPSLRKLAARLGIEDSVRFLGYLDREKGLPDCYAAADVFVFASRTETQGLVLLEAMAMAIPVVSTAVMGTLDIVGPQQGAIAVPEEEDSFAQTVDMLLKDRDRRLALGEEAQRFAQTWSDAMMAERMARAYARLLSQPVLTARAWPAR